MQQLPNMLIVGRVAKASVSFGHSHACLGGERVNGKRKERSTGPN